MHRPPTQYKLGLRYGGKCSQSPALAQTSLRYRKIHLTELSAKDPYMQWERCQRTNILGYLVCFRVVSHERRKGFLGFFFSF